MSSLCGNGGNSNSTSNSSNISSSSSSSFCTAQRSAQVAFVALLLANAWLWAVNELYLKPLEQAQTQQSQALESRTQQRERLKQRLHLDSQMYLTRHNATLLQGRLMDDGDWGGFLDAAMPSKTKTVSAVAPCGKRIRIELDLPADFRCDGGSFGSDNHLDTRDSGEAWCVFDEPTEAEWEWRDRSGVSPLAAAFKARKHRVGQSLRAKSNDRLLFNDPDNQAFSMEDSVHNHHGGGTDDIGGSGDEKMYFVPGACRADGRMECMAQPLCLGRFGSWSNHRVRVLRVRDDSFMWGEFHYIGGSNEGKLASLVYVNGREPGMQVIGVEPFTDIVPTHADAPVESYFPSNAISCEYQPPGKPPPPMQSSKANSWDATFVRCPAPRTLVQEWIRTSTIQADLRSKRIIPDSALNRLKARENGEQESEAMDLGKMRLAIGFKTRSEWLDVRAGLYDTPEVRLTYTFLTACSVVYPIHKNILVEWIEYHTIMGFRRFIIYIPDVTKDPDYIKNAKSKASQDSDKHFHAQWSKYLEKLNRAYPFLVIRMNWPASKDIEASAFSDCAARFGPRSQWLSFLSPLEFMVPYEPYESVRHFMDPSLATPKSPYTNPPVLSVPRRKMAPCDYFKRQDIVQLKSKVDATHSTLLIHKCTKFLKPVDSDADAEFHSARPILQSPFVDGLLFTSTSHVRFHPTREPPRNTRPFVDTRNHFVIYHYDPVFSDIRSKKRPDIDYGPKYLIDPHNTDYDPDISYPLADENIDIVPAADKHMSNHITRFVRQLQGSVKRRNQRMSTF